MDLFQIGDQYLNEMIPSLNKNENRREFERLYYSIPQYKSLDNVFFEIPNSMYSQRRGKYIKYSTNETAILEILHGDPNEKVCDHKYIAKKYGPDHMRLFRDLKSKINFKVKSKNINQNSWVIFARSVCSSALFLSKFRDFNELYDHCTKETPEERLKTADSIAKVRGAGAATLVMTLNWLKDIGIPGYCKPDIHLCRIMTGIYHDEFAAKGAPYSNTPTKKLHEKIAVQKDVFIKSIRQAEEDKADLFAFDRLLFLIGSGDFYGTDDLSKQLKSEYAASVKGYNKDQKFIDHVLNRISK